MTNKKRMVVKTFSFLASSNTQTQTNNSTMKKVYVYLVALLTVTTAAAQSAMEKKMEQRARELHRVIQLNDMAVWKKFVRENYTEALINKKMQARVEGDGPGTSSANQPAPADPVEAKAQMFKMLHNDFGDSEIVSIKPNGEKLDMVLKDSSGMKGTFSFKFENTAPYLINGISVEVGDVQR